MANKTKHKERSSRSRNDSIAGMSAMNHNSNLKTMQRKRMKEARNGGATS